VSTYRKLSGPSTRSEEVALLLGQLLSGLLVERAVEAMCQTPRKGRLPGIQGLPSGSPRPLEQSGIRPFLVWGLYGRCWTSPHR